MQSSSCAPRVVFRPALSSTRIIHIAASTTVRFQRSPTSRSSPTPPRKGFAAKPEKDEKTPNIMIYASNVAIITGDNSYGSIADIFEDTWRESFPAAWTASKATAEEEKGETIMDAENRLMADLKRLGLLDRFKKVMDITTNPDEALQEFEKQWDCNHEINNTNNVIHEVRRDFEWEARDELGNSQLLRAVRSKLNRAFETSFNTAQANRKFFMMELGATCKNQFPWFLGGRIDGFHNGRLTFAKNRVGPLFDAIPVHENVLFQCYLQLLNLEHGDFLQRVRSDTDTLYVSHTTIHQDTELFKTVVIPRLQSFCDFLEDFLSSPRFGVEYLLLQRADQEKFLQDRLKLPSGPASRTVERDEPDTF